MPKLNRRLGWLLVCVTLALPAGTAYAEANINHLSPEELAAKTTATTSPVGAARGAITFQERLIQSQERTAARMAPTNPRTPIRVGGPQQVGGAQQAAAAVAYTEADFKCLSEALYFEARGEGAKGQAAVAEVILNRVDSPAFPKSVCGVVNQPGQFSYKGAGLKRVRENGAFARVSKVARAALSGAPRSLTGGATYFHTPAVRPAWSSRFTRTARIGSHIFYRRGNASRVASN
ncbi:cell wall hydrolase [Paracoccus pacificus]|uniref:Cell wall hydrolase n=1 Tax=Paracoccus pacificus TaxID=1463598 RepID=A0ABW4R2X0_9RHOB